MPDFKKKSGGLNYGKSTGLFTRGGFPDHSDVEPGPLNNNTTISISGANNPSYVCGSEQKPPEKPKSIKDKEGKDLRYHYQVYQSKSGQDRLKYSQTYLLDIDGTPVYILDEIDKRVRKDREMVANAQFDANFIMRYKDIFFNQPGDFIKDKNGTPVLQKSALDRYVRECYAIEQARLYWGRIDKPKTAAGQQEFIEDLKENPLEFNILKPRQY